MFAAIASSCDLMSHVKTQVKHARAISTFVVGTSCGAAKPKFIHAVFNSFNSFTLFFLQLPYAVTIALVSLSCSLITGNATCCCSNISRAAFVHAPPPRFPRHSPCPPVHLGRVSRLLPHYSLRGHGSREFSVGEWGARAGNEEPWQEIG